MLTTSRDSSRVPVDSGDLVTKSFVSSWDATPDLGVVTGDSSAAVAEGEPENPSNPSSVTAAQFVTDETYGTVIDVDSGPLPEEGATTGVSPGASYADCCNRTEYLGGELKGKTLSFDIRLLDGDNQWIYLNVNT